MSDRNEVIDVIDRRIDHILKKSGMWGAINPQGLESLIRVLLDLRESWAPLPELEWQGGAIYNLWCVEYFGSHSNLSAAGRLAEKFGWKSDDVSYVDHEKTWPEVVEFYAELVRRERAAAESLKHERSE